MSASETEPMTSERADIAPQEELRLRSGSVESNPLAEQPTGAERSLSERAREELLTPRYAVLAAIVVVVLALQLWLLF
jgi:hypothetical protein